MAASSAASVAVGSAVTRDKMKDRLIHGSKITDYEILSVIGKGGFGSVYRAKSKHSGREVAIKTIDKTLMITAGLERRVVDEVRIHSQIKHKNIVDLLDCFEDQSLVYLVLEYCGGGDLYSVMKSQGSFSEVEAKTILKGIVLAVRELHGHGIMHRDLKLSNIFLSLDGLVKLGDFGMAADLHDGERDTVCGTANYLPPEMARAAPHSFGVDVWSLGCLLYALVTGSPPFESSHVGTTLRRASMGSYEIPENMSASCRDLLGRMLQEDPAKRISIVGVFEHEFLTEAAELGQSMDTSHDSMVSANDEMVHVDTREVYSTKRLQPVSHSIGNKGIICILENGDVCLDIANDPCIFVFSSDGSKIRLVNRNRGNVRRFTTNSIPAKYQKRADYVAKFLEVVRSRTPKVTLFSRVAQCYLMENGPDPDFSCIFYNGYKLHSRLRDSSVAIVERDGEVVEVKDPSALEKTRPWLLPVLKLGQEHLLRCLDAEREGQSFPLEICDDASRRQLVPSVSMSLELGKSEALNRHVGSMGSSIDSTITTNTEDSNATLPSPQKERSPERLVGPKSVFVKSLGWAMLLPTGQFHVQLPDGGQVLAPASNDEIDYSNALYLRPDGARERGLSEVLSSRVRAAWSHFIAVA